MMPRDSSNAPAANSNKVGSIEEQPIGKALMHDDGIIEIRLFAEGGGLQQDAMMVVSPKDPRYKTTLDHIGVIEPGGSADVRPFPLENDDL